MINILLIGGGGREHALAWKIAQSPELGRMFAAPGNPGIARHAELVSLDPGDHAAVVGFCAANAVGLVVVGPEAPLVAGLADALEAADVAVFGPSAAAARLEGSKGFTKDLCRDANIPTAAYARFADAQTALQYVRSRGAPIVVKADGLAAGKGVTVAATLDEAEAAIRACFDGAHGSAGAEVVVEDCLSGEEASFFALVDGAVVIPLATAQDHKRVGEGDTGSNTGGMGAYSPAPVMNDAMVKRVIDDIVLPTVATLAFRGTPYRGVLYAGLMIDADGPQLIEYNVRFGDPETQALMLRLESDLLPLMRATAAGGLMSVDSPTWSADPAMTVVMASRGYPGAYAKGTPIAGLEDAEAVPGVTVFHAGTAERDGALVANGGRVLNVTARGTTLAEARDRAYEAVDRIRWADGFCRRDIGWRVLGD